MTRLSELPVAETLLDGVARFWHGSDSRGFQPPADLPIDPPLWHASWMKFLARERHIGTPVVDISLYSGPDGTYHIGGTVGAAYRRQGYGREALEAVCLIAHQHLGIACLTAGCETTNHASRGWLVSCGFLPATGPDRLVLPNGRTIRPSWWRRSQPATLRCRNTPSTVPLSGEPADHRVPGAVGWAR